MFTVGDTVADRYADAGDVFGRSATVTGTVVGVRWLDRFGTTAELDVEWHMDTWSEYRARCTVFDDQVMLVA